MEFTSHKPNYELGQGSPLTCSSENLQARLIYIFLSFLTWIDIVSMHSLFPNSNLVTAT